MNFKPSFRPLVMLSLAASFFGHGPAVGAATTQGVNIGDNFFSPSSVAIYAGDQVTWTWIGAANVSHSSTSDSGLWDSGVRGTGSTFSRTFSSVGLFPYHCTVHANQFGSITVNPPVPAVGITSPANGATLSAPAKFTLEATATDQGGTITQVAFYRDNTLLATDTSAPYSVLVSNLPIGNYTFTAIAKDSFNVTATNSIAVRVIRDNILPTITLLKPLPLQRITNTVADVTVNGTAADDVLVTNVQVRINDGPWARAATSTDFAHWNAHVTPIAGTNVISAFATDRQGNNSITNRLRFSYVVPSTLTLITNGNGGISRTFKGNQLEVGRAYTVTAVAGPGQIFANWVTSTFTSSATVLNFVMQSNLVITANFVPNPFLTLQGRYRGLWSQPVRAHSHSGFISLGLTDQGAYSASLQRGTDVFPFSGQLDLQGANSKTVNGWLVNLSLDLTGSGVLTGNVGNSNWTADLVANHCVFSSLTNPATQLQGAYTLIVPGVPGSTTLPAGHGYGAVTVTPNGNLMMAGTLADNTPWSQSVPLSSDGQWACYVPLYGGLGSAWGWLLFDSNHPAAGITGDLDWIRPPTQAARYPLGFTNDAPVQGARYTAPTNSPTPVIALTNAIAAFADGNLPAPFTNQISFGRGNRVTNNSANLLTMSITRSNGVFAGSVKVRGAARTNTFKGAFLQDTATGYGFFLGTNLSGSVFIGPQP